MNDYGFFFFPKEPANTPTTGNFEAHRRNDDQPDEEWEKPLPGHELGPDPFLFKNTEFLESGYMFERRKLLKEKCKDYVNQTGIVPVTTRDTMHVMETYIAGTAFETERYNLQAVRYDPRFSSFFCLQHKAGSNHFNNLLAQIKNSVNPGIKHAKAKFAVLHAHLWLAQAKENKLLGKLTSVRI